MKDIYYASILWNIMITVITRSTLIGYPAEINTEIIPNYCVLLAKYYIYYKATRNKLF